MAVGPVLSQSRPSTTPNAGTEVPPPEIITQTFHGRIHGRLKSTHIAANPEPNITAGAQGSTSTFIMVE